MTKRKQTIGQLTTAQLMAMPSLPTVEREGWTLRYDAEGVRIWLQVTTGECCMDTKNDGRWTRKCEWFGGEPETTT